MNRFKNLLRSYFSFSKKELNGMFTIITCGDSKYFEFLQNFENNVFKIFGHYPTIYDLGLKDDEKTKDLSKEEQKKEIKE